MVRSDDFSNVLIIHKLSKFSWDQQRMGLSASEVLDSYRQARIDPTVILESHLAQEHALDLVTKAFPGSRVATREVLKDGIDPSIQYVIALGGDNSLTYVAKYLTNQILIGINSDPKTSVGALTRFVPQDADYLALKVADHSLTTEQWTRLSVTLNGELCPFHPLSEAFVGERDSLAMTRLRHEYNGQSESQKNSGVVVATGAGSTGWLKAVARSLTPEQAAEILPLPITALQGCFVVRELYQGEMTHGLITPGHSLLITSFNAQHGVIALDSDPSEPEFVLDFPAGAEAVFSVDPVFSLTVAHC